MQIFNIVEELEKERKKNKELEEKIILLKASEPMSKIAEDYGYKSRCEKAIEYINEEKYVSADENCEIIAGYRIEELLNILQGSDKE